MKTIQELIEEGIKIKTTCAQTNIQTIVRGDVYADWLTYCERLLRQQFPDDPQTIDIVNIGLHFILKNVRPYAASCSEA